jgi:2-desacetyl-2-hydroxyethyl bacteriochlorophyllide A dehydrogenase
LKKYTVRKELPMKAFTITEPQKYGLADVDIPEVKKDEVLLRVGASGICHSDLDLLKGTEVSDATTYPAIPGHEFAGEIVQVGSAVQRYRKNDKVVVEPMVCCRTCPSCRRGWIMHCHAGYDQLGITKPGGMAEYVAVPEGCLYKLPPQIDLVIAALIEPASCAAHGVLKAEITPGDSVVIIGAGSIGLLALEIARLFSPGKLIAIDIAEEKLDIARKLGATDVINTCSESAPEQIMKITNGLGADAVIDSSGSVKAIQESFSYIGIKAKTVVIGIPPQRRFEIDFLSMINNDSVFRAVNGYTTDVWVWVMELFCKGYISSNTIITNKVPLAEVDTGYKMLQERQRGVVKVMIIA